MARKRKAASDDAPKFDDKDRPWISNYPPLRRWLIAVDATCVSQIPYGNTGHLDVGDEPIPQSYLEQWRVNDRIIVIEVRAYRRGWEMWTSPDSIRVDETLVDAGKRCAIAQPEIIAAQACREPDGAAS